VITLGEPRLIVLITCHDLGRHLGCYGGTSVATPHLDALAADGFRFERAFSVAPQCSPSRAALATGRFPHANGVMGLAHGTYGWELHSEEQHVAELLSAHGYESHLFGLQHVTSDPQRLGFDRIHGAGSGREVAEEVARWCSQGGAGPRSYVEINLFEPHRPYDHGGVRPDESRGVQVPPYMPDNDGSRREMAALQGAIMEADRAIGRIVGALDDGGLLDDALIVFTADHGIAMPRAKCTLYDPGIEIALIMRWPGGGIGPAISAELVSNVDVAPTLLEITHIHAPEVLQGRSFLALLENRDYEPRAAVYAEKTWHSYYDPMRAIRTQRYKLIRNFESAFAVEVPAAVQEGAVFRESPQRYSRDRTAPLELYDLELDPLEAVNLASIERHSGLMRELDALLWQWMADTADPLLEGPVASPWFRRWGRRPE